MKKILFLIMGVALLSLPSCFKFDNWDEPGSTWEGVVIDSYTNEPILASQNDWQMRIWERSWTGFPDGASNFQDLRIKQDGTYSNIKLFDGTYDFLPYNGPFWPMDTVKNLVLKGHLKHDFTVTPYLQIVNFDVSTYKNANLDSIKITFKVKAPLRQKDGRTLPRLYELRAFLSLTAYCGNGNDSSIGVNDYTANTNINNFNEAKGLRVTCNNNAPVNNWDTLLAGSSDNTTQVITLSSRVKSGYTYYVRVGASVDDPYRKFCYSTISKVTIP
jgi:hypothetical protein